MRVRVTKQFDWKVPGKRTVISFPPGDHTMKREAGDECVRLGAGEEIVKSDE